jgi:hypothetical protein
LPFERVSGDLWARSMRFLARIETADPSPGAVESEPHPAVARKEVRTIPHNVSRKEGRVVEDSSVGIDSRLIVHLP